MRRTPRLHPWLWVGVLAVSVAPGCLFVDEEETPLERKIVLQLDVNPNQLKFKLGAPADAPATDPAVAATDPATDPTATAVADAATAIDARNGRLPDKPGHKRKPRVAKVDRPSKPRSGPSLEGLLMRIELVKLERARRGYKAGELPAVDEALARAERLLDTDRLNEASSEVAKAQRALDNFQIDRQYIERRLELLNRDPRVSNLSGEIMKQVSTLLDGVNRAYLQGNYRKANQIIEKIRKIVGAK